MYIVNPKYHMFTLPTLYLLSLSSFHYFAHPPPLKSCYPHLLTSLLSLTPQKKVVQAVQAVEQPSTSSSSDMSTYYIISAVIAATVLVVLVMILIPAFILCWRRRQGSFRLQVGNERNSYMYLLEHLQL